MNPLILYDLLPTPFFLGIEGVFFFISQKDMLDHASSIIFRKIKSDQLIHTGYLCHPSSMDTIYINSYSYVLVSRIKIK